MRVACHYVLCLSIIVYPSPVRGLLIWFVGGQPDEPALPESQQSHNRAVTVVHQYAVGVETVRSLNTQVVNGLFLVSDAYTLYWRTHYCRAQLYQKPTETPCHTLYKYTW